MEVTQLSYKYGKRQFLVNPNCITISMGNHFQMTHILVYIPFFIVYSIATSKTLILSYDSLRFTEYSIEMEGFTFSSCKIIASTVQLYWSRRAKQSSGLVKLNNDEQPLNFYVKS